MFLIFLFLFLREIRHYALFLISLCRGREKKSQLVSCLGGSGRSGGVEIECRLLVFRNKRGWRDPIPTLRDQFKTREESRRRCAETRELCCVREEWETLEFTGAQNGPDANSPGSRILRRKAGSR